MAAGSYGSYGNSTEGAQEQAASDMVTAQGASENATPPVPHVQVPPIDQPQNSIKPQKDFLVAWLLSLFLGVFGVDRFYLGKIGTGILKLITFGGAGIWWLIDLIMILAGKMRDKNGNELTGYEDKKKIAWIVSGAVLVLSLIINITSRGATSTVSNPQPAIEKSKEATSPAVKQKPAEQPSTAKKPAVKEDKPAEVPTKVEPSMTVSQEQAVSKAEDYLDYTSFSRSGLIKQLEFDDFTTADATFAVDHITVDWNEQAAKKAKDYLDYTSFSRGGLIKQLEFDGFTAAQAAHGVDSVGL